MITRLPALPARPPPLTEAKFAGFPKQNGSCTHRLKSTGPVGCRITSTSLKGSRPTTTSPKTATSVSRHWPFLTAAPSRCSDSRAVFADPLDHWWVRNESYINGIVYANKTFVAVAAGDNGTILTSPDGRLWTERWSRAGYYFYGIARSNKTFVAVGWTGAILTSPDGLT
jgi:hypothetical protein